MKIIGTDNLARETEADALVAENVSEFYAEHMVAGLNAALCTSNLSLRHYEAVADDRRLWRGMEDLV